MLPSRYQPITNNVLIGGFGSVLKCKDTYLDRKVMFKSMHDPQNNGQLINEVTALSTARSRHVVDIYDVILDGKRNLTGIIIEYLQGRGFENFHSEVRGNEIQYIRILYQIAIALKDLHSLNIVHRDLKLENFKESSSGLIKLFDFGISTNQPNHITVANRGTLVYAAPELFVNGANIQPSLDIYAFGICAWKLATNRLPQVLQETPPQQTRNCPSITTVMPNLHAKLAILLDSCLSVHPQKRPKASDLVNELKKHLLIGQHLGALVLPSRETYELSNNRKNVNISYSSLGEVEIEYDGFEFVITKIKDNVFVNNIPAIVGMVLPSACILVFGEQSLGSGRKWIPFSSSHPEVIL